MKRLIAFAAVALTCAAAFGHGGNVVTWTMSYRYYYHRWATRFDYTSPNLVGLFCGDECVANAEWHADVQFTFYREPMRVYVWKTTHAPAWGERWVDEDSGETLWNGFGHTWAYEVKPNDERTYFNPDWEKNADCEIWDYIFYSEAWGEAGHLTWETHHEFCERIKAEYVVSERAKKLLAEHTRGTMFTLQ